VFVYYYNGTGQNFQVYYNEQQPNFIVPQTSTTVGFALTGSPQAGLTNQQNWSQYQIAIAGAVAPATATTLPEIHGLVSPISATADTTPPIISSVTASGLTSTAVTIGWSTDEASDTQVEYGPTTAYSVITPLNATLVSNHSATLNGLTHFCPANGFGIGWKSLSALVFC
jgi:hypothetical protein